MNSLKYIWRNVTRNPLRTSLTILSVGFSLALMTVLYGYMAMQGEWAKIAEKYHRLVIMNIQGFTGQLPIAYVERVRAIPGIQAAVPYSWYGGNYLDEQMPFAQFATDPQAVFDVWSEFKIDSYQLAQWQSTRNGCVVDRILADKRNWKIGDRIPLSGTYYPFHLDLVLCGVFDAPKYTDTLWFHWSYLDEGLKKLSAAGTDNAGTIFAKVDSSTTIASIAKVIDDRFASSQNPTRTQSEAAFAQMFTDMLGNIQAYIRNIGLAVVFSLSLVAANAMAMSMRERTTEVAVLKAIGFSRARVLWMVLGEASSIALLGGTLGIIFGAICLQLLHMASAQFFQFPIYQMIGPWLFALLALAAGIGLISGLIPALQAARRSVVDGLRHVV